MSNITWSKFQSFFNNFRNDTIKIIFIYKGEPLPGNLTDTELTQVLMIPINPNELNITTQYDNEEVSTLQGNVNLIGNQKLRTLEIKSMFGPSVLHQGMDNPFAGMYAPEMYVNWIKQWQKSKKYADMIITGVDGFSLRVTPESFNYQVKQGEEDCYYYNLQLKEYNEYSSHLITDKANFDLYNIQDFYNPFMIDVSVLRKFYTFKPQIYDNYVIAEEGDTADTLLKKKYDTQYTSEVKEQFMKKNNYRAIKAGERYEY